MSGQDNSPAPEPQGWQKWLPDTRFDRGLVWTSIVAGLASLYFLFFFDSALFRGDEPMIGTIEPTGQVKLRVAKSLTWSTVRSKSEVHLKDIVYVPKGTKAQVKLVNGKSLALDSDSMVQFDEMNGNDIGINLYSLSDFELIKPVEHAKLTLLADPKPLELLHAEYVNRHTAFLNRSRLARRLIPVSNPYVAMDKLVYYAVVPISPASGENFNIKKNRWVDLAWSPVPLPGTTYEIDVAQHPGFGKYFTLPSRQTWAALQLEGHGDFFWRVRAKKGKEEITSETADFKLTYYGGIVSGTSLRLSNEKVAAKYHATISTDSSFQLIVQVGSTSQTSCSTKNLKPGFYYCRIKTLDKDKVLSTYRFQVK